MAVSTDDPEGGSSVLGTLKTYKGLVLAVTFIFLDMERAWKAIYTPVFLSLGTLSQSIFKYIQSHGSDPELDIAIWPFSTP